MPYIARTRFCYLLATIIYSFCFQIPGTAFALIGPPSLSSQTGLQASSPIQLSQRPASSLDERRTSTTLPNFLKPAQSTSGQLAIGPSSDMGSIQKASKKVYILTSTVQLSQFLYLVC